MHTESSHNVYVRKMYMHIVFVCIQTYGQRTRSYVVPGLPPELDEEDIVLENLRVSVVGF